MTISTESLRGNKIPGPLCDLIENMVNSINGELSSSSNETYRSMSDVQTDLQLMIDQPFIFLRDIDLEELSTNNLHFSETLLYHNVCSLFLNLNHLQLFLYLYDRMGRVVESTDDPDNWLPKAKRSWY